MKFGFPLWLATAALSSSCNGAVILECQVLLTKQNSFNPIGTFTAEQLVAMGNTLNWGDATQPGAHSGEARVGGGAMTIELEDGEVFISQATDLWVGHRDNPLWT